MHRLRFGYELEISTQRVLCIISYKHHPQLAPGSIFDQICSINSIFIISTKMRSTRHHNC
ncbi:CLUMA_CG002961, isoform A [Clunio marinus]|uniref:CLUMA_CG002961, isoform A n=1 Tax=Clunio marinus TaxID=568069 RepID=A0A1J1HSM9_9DIPT|nr:CLUMA_CG002961, isoform A [Clunio marinus]